MLAFENMFYSGTSNVVLPMAKDHFPEDFKEKTRLQYYGSLFNSVEINSTFYKLPKITTITNWAESVTPDFRFTFKIPKSITHAPKLAFAENNGRDFSEVVQNIGDRKGCLLAQFPPSFKFAEMDRLQEFLETFQSLAGITSWNLALEFRHPSWYVPEVNNLLQEYNAHAVLHDMINSTPPSSWRNVMGDVVYMRFHGPGQRYRGNYSDEFLKDSAEYIKECILQNKTVYVYFNNTMGAAFNNLQTLNKHVQADSF